MEKKYSTFTKVAGVALLAMGATAAKAESVSVPVSVTVNNAIDFTFTGELGFGEVRAVADADATDCSGLTLGANPSTSLAAADLSGTCSAGDSAMQSIGGTTSRPEFTIAGVAPFATLTLTLPADDAVSLTAGTAPPGSPTFELEGFEAYKTSGTPAALSGSITTDAAGGATFTVGATLKTAIGTDTGITNYEDLDYSGTFEVTVEYQ